MVDHPVTPAFLATLRTCFHVAPDHVQLIVGPPLWIHVSDQGDGHWSFGAQSGSWALSSDTFADLVAADPTPDADGKYVRADGTHVELVAVANTHAAEPDVPPSSPPPPPR